MKTKLENLGLRFSKRITDIEFEMKMEDYQNMIFSIEPTIESFKSYCNKIDWRICDNCKLIHKATDLKCVDGSADMHSDDEWITLNRINAFGNCDDICEDCFELFGNLKFFNTEELVNRLKETPLTVFRVGEIVVHNKKAYKIKEVTDDNKYSLVGSDEIASDNVLYPNPFDYVLCNEFAQIVDKDGSDIDDYDNWNTPSGEGQPEIAQAIEDYGLEDEFIQYLNEKGYGVLTKYLPSALKDAENSKYEKVRDNLEKEIIYLRFDNLEELNKYLKDRFDIEAAETSTSNEDVEEIGSDFCLLAGINENWGYVDIYYLLDNQQRLLITEVTVSEE